MEAFLDAINLLGQEVDVLAQLYRPLHEASATQIDPSERGVAKTWSAD